LLTGAKYKTNTELDIHATEANCAGVAWDVIHSIPWRGDEEFSLEAVKRCLLPVPQKEHDNMKLSGNYTKTSREREVAIVLFTAELLETSCVTDSI
jgi:hypothetical protein